MKNKLKIAIVSNMLNVNLYIESSSFYSNLFPKFEIINVYGKNKLFGLKFFHHIIQTLFDYDWIIVVDEDCFITNQKALIDLLQHQIDNNIDCSGMPDGGVISHRDYNPVAINPYFTILNLKKIRSIYNKKAIDNTRYTPELKKHAPTHLFKKKFDASSYPTMQKLPKRKAFGVKYKDNEPYYKLFFWMLKNGLKFLYLDAYNYDNGDEFTTILKNHEGVDFAYHTWYAREYNGKHKSRIDNIIKIAHEESRRNISQS